MANSLDQNEQPVTTPLKKVWQKPDFYILDTANVNGGSRTAVNEASFNSAGFVTVGKPKHGAWTGNGSDSRKYYIS